MPYFKSALRYEFYYSVIAQKRDCNIPNSYYNVCLLSTFSELQYLVAEGALAPEAKDIAVNRKCR